MSLLPVGFGSSGGYEIAKSLRFRSSAGAHLSRTPGVAGNRRTWTWSGWVKQGALISLPLFQQYTDGQNQTQLGVNGSSKVRFYDLTSNIFSADITWTPVLRDPSAWYHVLLHVDTTQATNTDRVNLYLNGARITQTDSATWPTQNADLRINNNTQHLHGWSGGAAYLDGYLSEINFIEGQALTPTSFGEINADGVWVPKRYTGTYGTNGFYLPFNDGTNLTALTTDRSGNGNNWTATNVSLTAGVTYDWMDDTPTNNFAVLNPLRAGTSALSNANLTSAGATLEPTIRPSSGTWYLERDGVSLTWTPPAAFPAAAGAYNFGQRPFTNSPTHPTLCTKNRQFTSITTSGSFTGNANADGPFVWLGGNPSSLTINGNAVTWGTHADKTAGGFKVRTSSASYNASGTNNYVVTVTGKPFGDAIYAPNNAQGNP